MFGPMALWPSVGDGGKYGPVLFIKILGHLQPKGPEGQRAENGPKTVEGSNRISKGQRALESG